MREAGLDLDKKIAHRYLARGYKHAGNPRDQHSQLHTVSGKNDYFKHIRHFCLDMTDEWTGPGADLKSPPRSNWRAKPNTHPEQGGNLEPEPTRYPRRQTTYVCRRASARLFPRAADQMPASVLAAHPRVIAAPHIGGLTPGAIEHQSMDTVAQTEALFQGRMPAGAVNAAHAFRLSGFDLQTDAL